MHRDVRNPDDATDVMRRVLAGDHRPTAVFAAQNQIAMGVFRAMREADVHHRVALVGYDDFALADMLDPSVTVIAQHPRAIGFRAAELLYERMAGGGSDVAGVEREPRIHVVPSHLIVRVSSLIPPPPS